MNKNQIALTDEPAADQTNPGETSDDFENEDESTPEPVHEPADAEMTDAAPADPGAASATNPFGPDSFSSFARLEALGDLRAAMDALPHEDAAGVVDTTTRVAANRLNALKSTGPRTAAGKRRSRMNALRNYSGRLTGAAQTVSLRLEPGGAERLYEQLVRPYQRPDRPVPAMLAMHFHDLARLRLELETWERIRDAEMEEQWRQGKIERRRRLHELTKDLAITDEQAVAKGVQGLPESAARAKKMAQYLAMIQACLAEQNFDVGPILTALYGKEHNPDSDEGMIICMQCDRLSKSKQGNGLTEDEFKQLLRLVAAEARDALAAYTLYLDEATMPEAACVARLKLTREDRAMSLHGERLRQAIDRKQRVIISLLRALGLNRKDDGEEDENGVAPPRSYRASVRESEGGTKTRKKDPKNLRNEATFSFRINKTTPKNVKNEPK